MALKEARYVLYIAAARERIFAALTEGAMTRRWAFGRGIESDWSPGAAVAYRMPDGSLEASGRVIECDPPRLVRFSLAARRAGADPAPFVVSYEIEPFGAMCRLVIHEDHDGATASARIAAVERGWPILGSALKTLLETGAVPDIDLAQLAAEDD